MTGYKVAQRSATDSRAKGHSKTGNARFRRRVAVSTSLGITVVLVVAGVLWLEKKASEIKSELTAATQLIPTLKEEISADNVVEAAATVEALSVHKATAKNAANDPLWSLASAIPGFGSNFGAVTEVARSADDVAKLGLAPLVRVYGSLDWDNLLLGSTETDLQPLQQAAPSVSSAAHAVRLSAERLNAIDGRGLLPQVADPLRHAQDQLQEVTGALDAAANAAEIVPGMLGSGGPRNYLLMVQNNAESRASGGIPGALAVLTFDNGKLGLGAQSSAAEVGSMSPVLPIDPEQQNIYSSRIGKFMQDVNLTPDFPTAASTAQSMWERKTGQHVDGVISVDPVALAYMLEATGPVKLTKPELIAIAGDELPTELTVENVVPTLLSDVYAKVAQPSLQDAYFAGVAQEIFTAFASGNSDAKRLMEGITRATQEGRILVWSDAAIEQSILAKYAISGSITGPSVSPAQFGVYFNDGTGAKMDYYVRRSVQLVKECAKDGYEQTTVRVTSTNTAPFDAATSLPEYVTGGGSYGVPPGSVQTNITVYGPAQANVETATSDGKKTDFAPYVHSNRPVGVLAIRLAPGESQTVEFTFGGIVQHTEPRVTVTPTIEDVKNVTLPTINVECY